MNYLSISCIVLALASGSNMPVGLAASKSKTASFDVSPTAEDIQIWQTSLQKVPPQSAGCWHAEYPEQYWAAKECDREATSGTDLSSRSPEVFSTGNGTDYSAKTEQLTRMAVGTFSDVKGVTSITSEDGKSYSLQMNTNFSDRKNGAVVAPALGNTSPFCRNNNLSACSTWQQFLYVSEGERINEKHPAMFRHATYIENWVFIPLNENCPTGWKTRTLEVTDTEKSCFRDSGWTGTPVISAVDNLDKIKLTGIASLTGQDVVMLFNGTNAYASSQSGKTLEIASTWSETEFNIAGPCFPFGTATFNAGSSLNVRLTVDDGTDKAPACINGGTTYEGTNLTPGKCTSHGGTAPFIEFTESN